MLHTSQYLQKTLESIHGKKVQLKINDNCSTMLSVRWQSDCTKVSLHRMFLQAPQNIMDALACYISKKDPAVSPQLKIFIEDNLRTLDYSNRLEPNRLCNQGSVYNLKAIFNNLIQEYFTAPLPLRITWFGDPNQRNRTCVTFGLYQDSLKLIKIHRMLDAPSVPDYLVSYVVYHEMLHYICPSKNDGRVQRIHSKEFKELEMRFRYYDLAQRWIKEHQNQFFQSTN